MKRTKVINEKIRLLIAALLIIACIWANWIVNNSAEKSSSDNTVFQREAVTAASCESTGYRNPFIM